MITGFSLSLKHAGKRTCLMIFAFMISSCMFTSVMAQDFRVYTSVANLSGTEQQKGKDPLVIPQVIARSLTFFHAGKTYDYMDELGELVIYDPAHERFIILNGKLLKKTQIEFSQLKQFLKVADTEARKYLEDLETKIDPSSQSERNLLQFQIKPEFKEEIQADKHKLICQSGPLTYTLTYADKVAPEYSQAYLAYADWAVRLNYILHSQSLLPGPRLEVNASLRKLKTVPTSVELKSDIIKGLHLRAEHTIRWELDATDRSRISDWEQLLHNPQVPALTFHDYQKLVLTTHGVSVNKDEKKPSSPIDRAKQ